MNKDMITIIDYDVANLGSISNMLNRIGIKTNITSDFNIISESKNLILPGVGSFLAAMKIIKKLKIDIAINNSLKNNGRLLGICLGMQLLFESSEEGNCEGLKLISGKVNKFPQVKNYKVPHMGWNKVDFKDGSPMNFNSNDGSEKKFYFANSYYVKCKDESNIVGTTKYIFNFTSAVQKDNIFGVQFHPEKSHIYGISLFKNFYNVK